MSSQSAGNFRAFTLKADNSLKFISIEVYITQVRESEEDCPVSELHKYQACINTGTQYSKISAKVIEDLALRVDLTNGEYIHPVDIYLPNKIRFRRVLARQIVQSPKDEQLIDCVIGMDILSCGDISLSGKDRKAMFSFRVPALGGEDFVETHRKLHKGKMVTTAATRNGPCPCGSGKKYKNCCGKLF